jgi:hypothetical protein
MKLSHIFLLLMMVTVLAGSAIAQDISLGLVGGLNFADMDVTGDGIEQKVSHRTVWGAGCILGVSLGEYLSIQMEPKYIRKGGMLMMVGSVVEYTADVSAIEMPLFLKAGYGTTIRPYVFAGPTIGYLLTADVEAELSGLAVKADWMPVSNKIEYGIIVGAGVSVPVWRGSLSVDGRYHFGLNNLNKGGTLEFKAGPIVMPEDISPDDEFSTKGFRIMIGYTLPLGGE